MECETCAPGNVLVRKAGDLFHKAVPDGFSGLLRVCTVAFLFITLKAEGNASGHEVDATECGRLPPA